MALPNPAEQSDQSAPISGNEQLIAQWQEPGTPSLLSRLPNANLIIIGGIVVAIGLIGAAFWLKDITYAMAAGVLISAGTALLAQDRRVATPPTIALSNTRLTVGNRSHPLEELGGFWLEQTPDVLAVHVEPKRGAAVPITFLYPTSNADECRDILLEVLPEVESRHSTVNDQLNRWLGQ